MHTMVLRFRGQIGSNSLVDIFWFVYKKNYIDVLVINEFQLWTKKKQSKTKMKYDL